MTAVAIAIGAGVAIAIVAAVIVARRQATSQDALAPEAPVGTRLRPSVAQFHVEGDTATVSYDVPLPAGAVDEHLRELLLHDAAQVVREKSAAGLPIDQVERVKANGVRDGAYVEAGVLDLREPGVIPEVAAPELVPHASVAGYDPLAHIGEQEFEVHPGIAVPRPEEGLEPFAASLQLSSGIESSLRAAGIDPATVSLEELTLGLLALGGYTVAPIPGGTGSGVQYLARKGSEENLVEVLPHAPGEHPELSEQALNEFGVAFAQKNPTRAMLVTDKFGPYGIYERERRNPKCRFITRERLQPFVDGFALQ